ncbi:MAG TPA: DNA repair exonuclease [Xanthobacteraceae bacterium]|jgi:exonuclease SbcD|nr:DNA repair exonuclease [Xanthobacteraceae bacterium]
MKFVHAADLHLDSPLLALSRQDARQVERMRRATREAFEHLIDLCIEQEVALLVLAGDLYDHDCPNMQIAVFLRNQLRRLEQKGIRAVIIKGNHDADNKITSALSLPANTRMLGERKPETITFDDLPVRIAVHGQSFKPGPITENLAASYPASLRGYYNIGLLHTSLAGTSDHDAYAPCTLEELTTRGYDYWALGHIHKRAVLARDPFVIFPGNLQGRHAKETGPKGCFLVEVDDAGRTVSAEFMPLDGVRWHQAEVDLKGLTIEAELVEGIRGALTQAHRDGDGRPGAVRVVLTGRTLLHPHIERAPHRLRQTTLELAGEISGDELWIEKIVNSTTPLGELVDAMPNEQTHDLVRIMQEIAGNAALVGPLLTKELESLRTKLPGELKELPCLKLLETPGLCSDALDRLEPRLAARLAGEEDV